MFFRLLDTKPYRTIMKLPRKLSFGTETCEIEPKVVIWSCPDLPRPVQEESGGPTSLWSYNIVFFNFGKLYNITCK